MAKVIVVGAGLVGPVMAMYLAKSGHDVEIWEKRADPRQNHINNGSSVNLTLCRRGLVPIAEIGLEATILDRCVPVYGRLIHYNDGRTIFQAYGNRGEAIFSISRADLHRTLLDHAERAFNVPIKFGHTCVDLDPGQPAIIFENTESGKTIRQAADIICAADGVHSSVRRHLWRQGIVDYRAEELGQGYKEISILFPEGKTRRGEREVLHLWPRHTYMLIAFPNIAVPGDFTGALHLPFQGENSFDSIRRPADLLRLFEESFSDVLPYVPNLEQEFFSKPVNRMTTIRSTPWHADGKVILLGDAAHAIYPLYGQGANAGFEDCRILTEILHECSGKWFDAFRLYSEARKRDMDAMAELCVSHSVELRDHAIDQEFQLRKDVERRVNELLSNRYMPLYSMIQFTLTSYADAVRLSREQNVIIERLMTIDNLEQKLSSEEFKRLVFQAAASL